MSSDPASDLFEPMCGQCRHWWPTLHYAQGGRVCRNIQSPYLGMARPIDGGCTYFEYKENPFKEEHDAKKTL